MTHTAFNKLIKQNLVSGAYLFDGNEEYLKEKTLETLRRAVLPQGFEALNESVLDAPDAQTIIESALAVPFMSEKRLVIAKDPPIYKNSKKNDDDEEEAEAAPKAEPKPEAKNEGKQLNDWLLKQCPDSCIVIIYLRGESSRKGTLYNEFLKAGRTVSFDQLTEYELISWLKAECKGSGCTISDDGADQMISSVGASMHALKGELEKLIAYKGSGVIDTQDVLNTVTVSIEDTVFNMIDDIVAQKYTKAYKALNTLLENNARPADILSLITRQLRLMAHAKAIVQKGGTREDVQTLLNIEKRHTFIADKLIRQCRAVSLNKLAEAYKRSAHTDYLIKSGRIGDRQGLDEMMLILGETGKK